MMRIASVQFVQGRHPAGPLSPTAIVLHRTYGSWAGDSDVGRNGRAGVGIGFHFLVGKATGRATQFYDTSIRCYHALGANSWAVGIEFEGRNDEPLTDWQIDVGALIVREVCGEHGIPLTYTVAGPRRRVAGCLPHALVPGSDHTDLISVADWERMFPPTPPPYVPPTTWEDDEMTTEYFTVVDVTEPKAWPPAGAVLRITDTTFIHLSPDEWGAELRIARIAQRPLVAGRMSQSDAQDICSSRVDVRALNTAAHR